MDASFEGSALIVPYSREILTQKNDNAGKDGDEGTSAQASVQDVGLSITGQQCPIHVTPTDLDGEGIGATHGWDATITDHDGQEVEVLLLSTETSTSGIYPCSVICLKKRDRVYFHHRTIPITVARSFPVLKTCCVLPKQNLECFSLVNSSRYFQEPWI